MPLMIQDPSFEGTSYFLESLLEAVETANCGIAVFAFATAEGCRMLFSDEVFAAFAYRGPLEIVVGVDAITDARALAELNKWLVMYPKIQARAFLHPRKESLFHPKFCWFGNNSGGTLLAGSANLTIGGLRSNWEAYCTESICLETLTRLRTEWDTWTQLHEAELLSLEDPRVADRASKNTGWANLSDRSSDDEHGVRRNPATNEVELESIGEGSPVLLAEIPKSGNRWNQANFDIETYEGFFGARIGTQRRMFFQHVDFNGILGEIESRPSVAVASRNYRFELAAAAGVAYPEELRPIGLFVRVATRSFRYTLILPHDFAYSAASEVLDKLWDGQVNHMRRVRLTVFKLKALWPNAPV